MIKSKEGVVKYKGPDIDIRADLICIFRALSQENLIKSEQDLLNLYRMAHMSEDELNGKLIEKMKEIRSIVEDMKNGL